MQMGPAVADPTRLFGGWSAVDEQLGVMYRGPGVAFQPLWRWR